MNLDRNPENSPSHEPLLAYPSPLKILAIVLASTFAVEVGVMLILARFPPMPMILAAVVDATVLSLLLVPLLVLFLFRPLRRQMQQIQEAERNYRLLFENNIDGIFRSTPSGRFLAVNPALARLLGYGSPQEVIVAVTNISQHVFDRPEEAQQVISLLTGQGCVQGMELGFRTKDNRAGWVSLSAWVVLKSDGTIDYMEGNLQDITARKLAEQKAENLRSALMEASRLAGRADVAAEVLHNVGNSLNSVNVSALLLLEMVRNSKVKRVGEVAALLREHPDIAQFLTDDPKGRRLPIYLSQLGNSLLTEKEANLKELDALVRGIEQVMKAVAMQQTHVGVVGVDELTDLSSLTEDAIALSSEGMTQDFRLRLVREYEPLPPQQLDRHKVRRIIAHLIRNARTACLQNGRDDKIVKVRLRRQPQSTLIEVIDNGVGISPERLNRIFSQGFTDHQGHHGFGLHGTALAANELGGSLIAESNGLDQGATFRFELPFRPAAQA